MARRRRSCAAEVVITTEEKATGIGFCGSTPSTGIKYSLHVLVLVPMSALTALKVLIVTVACTPLLLSVFPLGQISGRSSTGSTPRR
jgi:hypothetical protein